jgi:hypothetical protein
MVYTQMLFALAFDEFVFGVTPGMLSILGSTLILGSAIYVAVKKDHPKTKEDVKGQELDALVADEEQGFLDEVEDEDRASSSTVGSEIETQTTEVEQRRR